jgi:pantoate--beta-alanine ligase
MREVGRIAEVRAAVGEARRAGRRVAFVPTMGALHAGHLQLVTRARAIADVVVMSVFVNPLQFGPTEDFARYPRDARGDAALARDAGVDLLFMPDVAELYPREMRVRVVPAALAERWEGAVRPGHFGGVLTVVLKLLNVVAPDVAVFGQKDYQQAALVRAMVADLDLPVEIVVEPTVREADGLAMSSRNRYLDPAARAMAARIPAALRAAERAFAAGERDARAIERAAAAELAADGAIAPDYVAVVDAATLEPSAAATASDVLLLAARVGGTRLIDNGRLGGA